MKDFLIDLGLRVGMFAIDLIKKKYGTGDNGNKRNLESAIDDDDEYDPDEYSGSDDEDELTDDELYDLKKGKEKNLRCPYCGSSELLYEEGSFRCCECEMDITERDYILNKYGRINIAADEDFEEIVERNLMYRGGETIGEDVMDWESFDSDSPHKGNHYSCKECSGEHYIRFDSKKNEYFCRHCGKRYGRREFIDIYEIYVAGEKCYTCNVCYPGCTHCHNGYDVDFDKDIF